MVIKKKKDTFNDYDLQLSWGQLEAIRNALESDHADPMSDELLAELQWYMARVPGPGEEEEDKEARQQGAEAAGEDFPIPMPPGQETTEPEPTGEPTGEPPAGEPSGGAPEGEPLEAPPEGEAGPPPEEVAPAGPPAPEGETEERLPAPPEE